jgi:hypothetical protein
MASIARNHLLEALMKSIDQNNRAAKSPRDLVKRFKVLTLTLDEKPNNSIGRLFNSADGSSLVPLLLERVDHNKKKRILG